MTPLFVLYVLACAPTSDLTEVCRDKVMTPPVSERQCTAGRDALLNAAEAEGVSIRMAVCAPAIMEVRDVR